MIRGIIILARCEYHFIKVHENMMQQPINNISFITSLWKLLLDYTTFVWRSSLTMQVKELPPFMLIALLSCIWHSKGRNHFTFQLTKTRTCYVHLSKICNIFATNEHNCTCLKKDKQNSINKDYWRRETKETIFLSMWWHFTWFMLNWYLLFTPAYKHINHFHNTKHNILFIN